MADSGVAVDTPVVSTVPTNPHSSQICVGTRGTFQVV